TDGPGAPPDPSRLPPAQRAVYEALVGGPLTARALARRLRRKYNSNFRSLLARMTRAGLIHREAGRYVRQGDARTGDSHPDQNA
ncbi:MAG TPA: hypothetical protein VFW33_13145, partial [Gemmataceae bacterium]|nr:hypothetical protein [Gemmataceae bacterium]